MYEKSDKNVNDISYNHTKHSNLLFQNIWARSVQPFYVYWIQTSKVYIYRFHILKMVYLKPRFF